MKTSESTRFFIVSFTGVVNDEVCYASAPVTVSEGRFFSYHHICAVANEGWGMEDPVVLAYFELNETDFRDFTGHLNDDIDPAGLSNFL